MSFTRIYCTATSEPSITKLAYKTHIESENLTQGIGRLSRNYDDGAIMVIAGVDKIAPLRFQPPPFPSKSKLYDTIREPYEGRCTPTVSLNAPEFATAQANFTHI